MKKSSLKFMAIMLAAGTLTGCSLPSLSSKTEGPIDAPALLTPIDVPASTAVVAYRDLAITSYHEATVVPYVEEYSFPISGTISAKHFKIGDMVNAGDLLFTLTVTRGLRIN